MVLVEITLVLTIHRLALTLKLITGDFDQSQLRCRERLGIAIAVVYMCSFLAFDVYVMFIKGFHQTWSKLYLYCNQALYISLTFMYTVVIVMLNRVMKRLDGNFDSEITSVNCQFLFFLFAYLFRIIVPIILER